MNPCLAYSLHKSIPANALLIILFLWKRLDPLPSLSQPIRITLLSFFKILARLMSIINCERYDGIIFWCQLFLLQKCHLLFSLVTEFAQIPVTMISIYLIKLHEVISSFINLLCLLNCWFLQFAFLRVFVIWQQLVACCCWRGKFSTSQIKFSNLKRCY